MSTTRRPYPSDLSDAEWELLAPLLPPPSWTGRLRKWPARVIADAIFYVLRSGCAWLGQSRRLSKDYERLPETGEAMIHAAMSRLMLRRLARAASGRRACPCF